jgi:Phosphoglycerate dehydrogenase and related dehydrogenases
MKPMKRRVAVTTSSFGEFDGSPIKLLEDGGCDVLLNSEKRKLNNNETRRLCLGCCGVIAGTEKYDRLLLSQLRELKVISRCGAGTENIDIVGAEEFGIRVCNTPDAPTEAVAELAVGLMIGLLRHIPQMDAELKGGGWKKRMGNMLKGKKIGIVGFGRIGKKVAVLLKSFSTQTAYFDLKKMGRSPTPSMQSLKELLRWSDIVTLHCGFGRDKAYIIGESHLKLMKKGSWLINTSRGELVDEQALVSNLKNGHLAGAALDVFSGEPYNGPLSKLDNVIITPHVGSYAKESRIEMENQAATNLLNALEELS